MSFLWRGTMVHKMCDYDVNTPYMPRFNNHLPLRTRINQTQCHKASCVVLWEAFRSRGTEANQSYKKHVKYNISNLDIHCHGSQGNLHIRKKYSSVAMQKINECRRLPANAFVTISCGVQEFTGKLHIKKPMCVKRMAWWHICITSDTHELMLLHGWPANPGVSGKWLLNRHHGNVTND